MKKILFVVLAAALMSGTAMAQIPIGKGDFFVNANTSQLDLSFGNGTNFTLGANGGYFIINKLAIVGGLNIGTQKISGVSNNHFNLNVGARYHFWEQSKGCLFASALMGVEKYKNISASFAFTLNAGYAFFLTEHIALEPLLTLMLPFNSDYDVTFSIGGGISIYF
jgi:hypothetical protein